MGASNEGGYKEGLCGTYERDEKSMQNYNLQSRTKDWVDKSRRKYVGGYD